MINTVKVNNNQTEFVMLLKEFIESYAKHYSSISLNDWLSTELKAHLPEKSPSEISAISTGIISSLESIQAKRESLDRSISRGRTKSEWFAKELKNAQADGHVQEIHDSAVNAQRDILAKSGVIDAEFADPTSESPANPEQAAREIQNAAVLGSVLYAEGCGLAGEVLRDSDSPYSKFVTDTLTSGDTTGLKAAASGAVKTASERGMLSSMPSGTSEHVIAGVGYIAVEKVKTYTKKVPFVEMVEKTEREALAVAGDMLKFANELGSLGAAIGSVFGPMAAIAGGVIGGVTGFIAGTAAAQTVVDKTKELRHKIIDIVSSYAAPALKKAVEAGRKAAEDIKSAGTKILGLLFG